MNPYPGTSIASSREWPVRDDPTIAAPLAASEVQVMGDGTFCYVLQHRGCQYQRSPPFRYGLNAYIMEIIVAGDKSISAHLSLAGANFLSASKVVNINYTVTIAWSSRAGIISNATDASFSKETRYCGRTTGVFGAIGKFGVPLSLHGAQVTVKFNSVRCLDTTEAINPASSSSSASSSTPSSTGSSASTVYPTENGIFEYVLQETDDHLRNCFRRSPRFKHGMFEFDLHIGVHGLGDISAVLRLVNGDINERASAVSCGFTVSILWHPARVYWGEVTSKGEFSEARGWAPHFTDNIGKVGENGVPKDLAGYRVRIHIHNLMQLPPMSTKEVAAKNSGSTSSNATSSSAGLSASTAENGKFEFVLQQLVLQRFAEHKNLFEVSPVFKYGAFEFDLKIFLNMGGGNIFAELRLVNKDIDSKASAVNCEFTVIIFGPTLVCWGEITSKGEFSAASGWKPHHTGKIGEIGKNGVPADLAGSTVRLHIRNVVNLPPMMNTSNKTALDEVVACALTNPASSSSQGRPANSCANYANCKRIGQFCINCRVHVCNACCITHHRPLFKDTHTLVAYQSPWCESHGDSHEHYCTVCETLACPRCYIEKHLDHYGSMISVAHHANNRREQLAEKRSFVDVELERLRKVHESLENEIAALEFQKETLSALTKHHEDVNAMVLFVSEDKLINETEFSLLLGMIKALKSTKVAKK